MILNAVLIALRQIFRNPLRSFLTMLGVVIGVASVIAMVNFGKATRENITQSIASLGSNLLIIFPSRALDPRGVSVGRLLFSQREVDFLYARIASSVQAFSPFSGTSALLQYGGKNVLSRVNGVGEQYLQATNSHVGQGRGFREEEFRGSRVCIIGNSVKKQLYPQDNPLGSNLKIGDLICEVVGVLAEKGQGAMGQDQDDVVLLPLKTFNLRLNPNSSLHNISRIFISLREGSDSTEVGTQALEVLKELRGLGKDAGSPFEVMDTKEILRTVDASARMLTIFITTIAGISLFVGGIGIMNMMLVSVSERTREIGIRIAIGATAGEVLLQFLIESVVLSLCGGVLGLCLSVGLTYALVSYFELRFLFDCLAMVASLGFCVLIGVVFGYLPARKASKLNPIEALRYE